MTLDNGSFVQEKNISRNPIVQSQRSWAVLPSSSLMNRTSYLSLQRICGELQTCFDWGKRQALHRDAWPNLSASIFVCHHAFPEDRLPVNS